MGVLADHSTGALHFFVDYARRQIGDFEFSVCVASAPSSPVHPSLLLGGNVGVGLEDNISSKGSWPKQRREVAMIARIAQELGVEPAYPRGPEVSGLKGWTR
jgi:uncharacterized protein (DUF849 family)